MSQLAKQNFFHVDFRLRIKSFDYKWIRCSGKVTEFAEDGYPLILCGTHIDVTEKIWNSPWRKVNYFRGSKKDIKSGFAGTSPYYNKLSYSDQLFEIFEIDKEFFDGSYDHFFLLIHPDDLKKVREAYQNSVKNKTSYQTEHRLKMQGEK